MCVGGRLTGRRCTGIQEAIQQAKENLTKRWCFAYFVSITIRSLRQQFERSWCIQRRDSLHQCLILALLLILTIDQQAGKNDQQDKEKGDNGDCAFLAVHRGLLVSCNSP